MGKIVVSENVTLDGVVQDPAGAEGFGRGGWVGRVDERGQEGAAKVLLDEALGAEAPPGGRLSGIGEARNMAGTLDLLDHEPPTRRPFEHKLPLHTVEALKPLP